MKHTLTLALAVLAFALTATAQERWTFQSPAPGSGIMVGANTIAQPHIVPQSATIHVGDVQEFHFPVSNTSATMTWQVIESNSLIGQINPSNLNPNTGRFTTDTMPGSVLVRCQSSDYPGQWFYATLTVIP